MNATERNAKRRWTVWLWPAWLGLLAVWTLALLTTYPVQVKEQVLPADAGFPAAKMLHLTMYALLAGSAAFLPLRGVRRWLPILVLSLHGFGTEFGQTFVPLRTGSWSDVALDHAGLLFGLILTLPWWLPRTRRASAIG